MRTILKILIILTSLFSLYAASWAEMSYTTIFREEELMIASIVNLIGSPTPILYGLGTYFSLQSTLALLGAMFKKYDTKAIRKNYFIKSSIIIVFGVIFSYIGFELDAGYPEILVGGSAILFTYTVGFFLLEIGYRKRRDIWYFLVNK